MRKIWLGKSFEGIEIYFRVRWRLEIIIGMPAFTLFNGIRGETDACVGRDAGATVRKINLRGPRYLENAVAVEEAGPASLCATVCSVLGRPPLGPEVPF